MRSHVARVGAGAALVVLLGAACAAQDPPGYQGSSIGGAGEQGSPTQAAAGATSTSKPDDVEHPTDCSPTPGHVLPQRLTRDEYDRSVADLFGVTSAPARAFPPDSATSGFDNNAESLTISPQLLELLLNAAEAVASDAMASRSSEILVCDPNEIGESECAEAVLSPLARRVYRRPLSAAELADLVQLVVDAQATGDSFEASIEHAISAMLVSPQFLYRNLPPPGGLAAPDAEGQLLLDQYSLATRLSYFLWGSTPDAELLDRAEEGVLHDPSELQSEFARLLEDQRSSFLYSGFLKKWLMLGRLEAAYPDADVFPQFDEGLRTAMAKEVELFFEDLRGRNGSSLELISSSKTFANEALANIYQVTGVTGSDFVPLELDPKQRAGVLTMPAVLTMTSDPDRTNIVKRGAWVAEAILCAKPPPPPEDVPPLPPAMPGESERERLARHRADPACANCHDVIDPLGYAFESYDPIGAWRDEVDSELPDTLGELPDGSGFDGVVEMVALLESNGQFGSCLTQRMMTYALGRSPTSRERCLLDAISAQAVTPEASFSDLLWAVVQSPAFQKRDAMESN